MTLYKKETRKGNSKIWRICKKSHKNDRLKRSFWQRFYEGFNYFAEAIVINPSTNKVYVSDSKNNLLYEIDG